MKTIKHIILLLSIFFLSSSFADAQYFILKINDKTGTPYSINAPEDFLSEAAIDRRIRNNIPVTEEDLPLPPQYLQDIRGTGAKILNKSKWFKFVTVRVDSSEIFPQLSNLSFINEIIQVKELNSKKSSDYQKFRLENNYTMLSAPAELDYGFSSTQIKMLNGDYLHNNGFTGQGMTIAVLDAGFSQADVQPYLSKLRDENRIITTKNIAYPGETVFGHHTHGMNVLSIMAAYRADTIIGSAPDANYVLITTENTSYENIIEEYNWIAGAEFADSLGVDVINTSLGYNNFDNSEQNHSYSNLDGNTCLITKAAQKAANKGIIVVVSAGNEGDNPWRYITAPGDANDVLTVGSVTSEITLSNFSSVGPTADGRIKPDVVAMGSQTIIAGINGGLYQGSGTSFAAPIIAGLSACLLQANSSAKSIDVVNAIKKSASQYDNPDNFMGYGLPNFAAAELSLRDISFNNFNTDKIIKTYINNDVINVDYYSKTGGEYIVTVVDITGKNVMSIKKNFNKTSYNQFHIAHANLRRGTYILNITNAAQSSSGKFIVFK